MPSRTWSEPRNALSCQPATGRVNVPPAVCLTQIVLQLGHAGLAAGTRSYLKNVVTCCSPFCTTRATQAIPLPQLRLPASAEPFVNWKRQVGLMFDCSCLAALACSLPLAGLLCSFKSASGCASPFQIACRQYPAGRLAAVTARPRFASLAHYRRMYGGAWSF